MGHSLKVSMAKGGVTCIKVHGYGLASSHLQFGDYTMLTGVPIVRGEKSLQVVLKEFMEVLVTYINQGKSQIFPLIHPW